MKLTSYSAKSGTGSGESWNSAARTILVRVIRSCSMKMVTSCLAHEVIDTLEQLVTCLEYATCFRKLPPTAPT
jgi:hypothetical protein